MTPHGREAQVRPAYQHHPFGPRLRAARPARTGPKRPGALTRKPSASYCWLLRLPVHGCEVGAGRGGMGAGATV